MDLHVERQCVEQIKQGDLKKFFLLFDAYFEDLYKYVARRVEDGAEVERIVRLSFMDALGQAPSTPEDLGYLVWLYSMAKPRVWKYIDSAKKGIGGIIGVNPSDEEFLEKVQKMFGKLSLEEREIIRLKFFEELTDGDVMMILGDEEGAIGPKIYRVLKRAHFLLFGESDERQGVYFGELAGFLDRVKKLENIEVPEMFKLSLRADLSKKIDQKEFALESEAETVEEAEVPVGPSQAPWAKDSSAREEVGRTGSDDPAKIFVEAVKEIREEEAAGEVEDQVKFEKREKIFEFFEKWKLAFTLVPAFIFVLVAAFVVFNLVNLGGERKARALCREAEIIYSEQMSEELLAEAKVLVPCVCSDKKVVALEVNGDENELFFELDLNGANQKYSYQKVDGNWEVKKHARNTDSKQKSRKV